MVNQAGVFVDLPVQAKPLIDSDGSLNAPNGFYQVLVNRADKKVWAIMQIGSKTHVIFKNKSTEDEWVYWQKEHSTINTATDYFTEIIKDKTSKGYQDRGCKAIKYDLTARQHILDITII